MKTQKYEREFIYLDRLRRCGVVNMYGAGGYIMDKFGVDKYESRKILKEWMDTFDQRHPKGEQ